MTGEGSGSSQGATTWSVILLRAGHRDCGSHGSGTAVQEHGCRIQHDRREECEHCACDGMLVTTPGQLYNITALQCSSFLPHQLVGQVGHF
jgi:hypothetical protein